MSDKRTISLSWDHGLGDTAHFVRMLMLYRARGFRVEIKCESNKRFLFDAVGCSSTTSPRRHHGWPYPPDGIEENSYHWRGNKNGGNLGRDPLPSLGKRDQVWHEYVSPELTARCWEAIVREIPRESTLKVKRFCAELPRGPLVLLHGTGNTGQGNKSLGHHAELRLIEQILTHSDATVLQLDWDHRAPRLYNARVRHLTELRGCGTADLMALIERADLTCGVDSGPLHCCQLLGRPAVGLWPSPASGHHPARYSIPCRSTVHFLWGSGRTHHWTAKHHAFQLCPLESVDLLPGRILQVLARGPADQYLDELCGRCYGDSSNGLASHADRHTGFRRLLAEAKKRFKAPVVVETGTVRQADDWQGAGCSTVVLACFTDRAGGSMWSVDLEPKSVELARRLCREMQGFTAVESRGDEFLKSFDREIDVLYLDSVDCTVASHARDCHDELTAAMPRLHDRSIVAIDDTPWRDGLWIGKGATAVPWMLERGWRILYAGYQVIMVRR